MKARLARATLFAAVVAAAWSSPLLAADPATLGARISPTNFIIERQHDVVITNLSNVAVHVHLVADGNGWALATNDFPLGPAVRRTVAITAIGAGDVAVRATLTPLVAPGGQDAASLVLETKGRHLGFWDAIGPWAGYGALVFALFVIVGYRLRRRVRR